jgi:ubiquinone/menaquinone biosynthesis C-methylase UbiE
MHSALCQEHHRIDFFERFASSYDILIDLFTFGLYSKFLKRAVETLSPQNGEKILDLCSGTGRVASWIARTVGKEGEVVGMDIAKSMVEVAKNRYSKLGSLIFLRNDITQPWEYENHFDGIFISFGLHELPNKERRKVLERCYLALKVKGRIVIADFNPYVSRGRRMALLTLFKLFEKENANFFPFEQNQILEGLGFKKIKTFLVLFSLFQITLAHRSSED